MANPVISSKKVQGTAVYNPQGVKLGSINDLIIDKVSGNVRYAELEFGGFLGMGTDLYPLPWGKLSYSTEHDGYVVPLTEAQLVGAPRYSADARPDYTDDYGHKVYDHYGLAWMY